MLEFVLCEKFGWTLTELYDQPANKVTRFTQIMHIRSQTEKMKEQANNNG